MKDYNEILKLWCTDQVYIRVFSPSTLTVETSPAIASRFRRHDWHALRLFPDTLAGRRKLLVSERQTDQTHHNVLLRQAI